MVVESVGEGENLISCRGRSGLDKNWVKGLGERLDRSYKTRIVVDH